VSTTATAAFSCPLCGSERISLFGSVCSRRYYECGVCELVHLEPGLRLSPDRERAIYESHENHPGDAAYRAFLDRLAGPLTSKLSPGARGLDYGCGPGPTLSVMLQERGFETAVYDPFFAPDAGPLRQRYDFVACTEVAEHFFSPGAQFERLDALLRPGGWLGVMTAMRSRDQAFESWHYPRDPTHVSFYGHSTMRWLAARFGWAAEFPHPNVTLFQKQHLAR
jgi:hypothetical protein